MGGSSKAKAAQNQNGGSMGGGKPGNNVGGCKHAKPPKAQTVEPFIAVATVPTHWYENAGKSKERTGKIKLKASKRNDELGYKETGRFAATGTAVRYYSDSKCERRVTPETVRSPTASRPCAPA